MREYFEARGQPASEVRTSPRRDEGSGLVSVRVTAPSASSITSSGVATGAGSAAGAGVIGEYELCSIEVAAIGTYRGGEHSNPVRGERGRLERVDEVRLEMVCGDHNLALAIEHLRSLHPYEEPPIEIYRQAERPRRAIGAGRRVTLDHGATIGTITDRMRDHLGTDRFADHDADRREELGLLLLHELERDYLKQFPLPGGVPTPPAAGS